MSLITIVTICFAVIITDSICSIKPTSGVKQRLGVVIKPFFFSFFFLVCVRLLYFLKIQGDIAINAAYLFFTDPS